MDQSFILGLGFPLWHVNRSCFSCPHSAASATPITNRPIKAGSLTTEIYWQFAVEWLKLKSLVTTIFPLSLFVKFVPSQICPCQMSLGCYYDVKIPWGQTAQACHISSQSAESWSKQRVNIIWLCMLQHQVSNCLKKQHQQSAPRLSVTMQQSDHQPTCPALTAKHSQYVFWGCKIQFWNLFFFGGEIRLQECFNTTAQKDSSFVPKCLQAYLHEAYSHFQWEVKCFQQKNVSWEWIDAVNSSVACMQHMFRKTDRFMTGFCSVISLKSNCFLI